MIVLGSSALLAMLLFKPDHERVAGHWRFAGESGIGAIGFAGIKEVPRALRSVARC